MNFQIKKSINFGMLRFIGKVKSVTCFWSILLTFKFKEQSLHRTRSQYYQTLRRTNPKLFWSRKTQTEMFHQQQKMQDAFYDQYEMDLGF